ncbi:peptidylprolyl isomerase [Deinococcus pimensis]|uniref:peptidylprolyl isomerase n=1 Tax=Deinococcus pimensis TaxID=309888 RepID=UPI00048138C0|nr:peptidylprolyl isomerase [Deinococcus pimensis]
MKKTLLIALLPLLLLGCRDRDAGTSGTTGGQTQSDATTSTPDTSSDTASATGDTATGDTATTGTSGTTNAAPGTAPKPGPVPSGYTRVAELSKAPVRSFKEEPKLALEDGKDYAAVVDTTEGQMVIDLYEDVPTTVNSFVWLARHHFYDGLLFHRVIEGFVVQGGDPNTATSDRNTWGQGGPGYSIPLEIRTKYNFDEKGVLGMARAQDPNSGGSQFYITLAPASSLNSQYTVFGKVVQGEDVLDKIKKYEAPAQGDASKMLDVYIVTKNK